VRTVTLEAPGKNALGTAVMERLIADLDAAAGAPVLVTGSPLSGAFSAGLDLKEVATLEGAAMMAFLRLLERCMTALFLYPGPTAAAVNGHAIAGGCVLTLCCDVRVARDDATIKIGLNEVALGLRFPPRTLSIVRSRIPSRHEAAVLLGADLVEPREALRLGLVDEVAADPVARARARLEVLAAHPLEAYGRTKRDLRGTEEELCATPALERWLEEATPVWTAPPLRARIAAMFRGARSRQ